MSYTSPKTWNFRDTLSSSDMNVYVRDNIISLADGTGISTGAILSKHFKPIASIAYGVSATMATANTDYDVVSVTISPTVTSDVWIWFTGTAQLNTAGTVTVWLANNGVKDTTANHFALAGQSYTALAYIPVALQGKFTATAGSNTYKAVAQCNQANISAARGQIVAWATAQ